MVTRKKKVTIIVGGVGLTLVALLAYLSSIPGVTVTGLTDYYCADRCNITFTICTAKNDLYFNISNPFYFSNGAVLERLVDHGGNFSLYGKTLKAGQCWNLTAIVKKDKAIGVKYGFSAGGVNVDPWLYPEIPQGKDTVYKDGIAIISNPEATCLWKNASSPERDCYIEMEVENFNTGTIAISNLNQTWKRGVTGLKVLYSTTIENYTTTIKNESCLDSRTRRFNQSLCYNISGYKYTNWKPFALSSMPVGKVGVRLEFKDSLTVQGGVYIKNQFNLTLNNVELDPDITTCSVLSSNNVYLITADFGPVGFTGPCLDGDDESNITLDCQSHSFYGYNNANTGGIGFSSDSVYNYNITVRNCRISKFEVGLDTGGYSYQTDNVTITNMTIFDMHGTSYGGTGLSIGWGMNINLTNINSSYNTQLDYIFNPGSDEACPTISVTNCNATNKVLGFINANNTVYANKDVGEIYVCASNNVSLINITMIGLGQSNQIEIYDSPNSRVQNLYQYGGRIGLYPSGYSQNFTAINFTVANNYYYGVAAYQHNSSYINGTVLANKDIGMLMGEVDNNVISGVNFSNGRNVGLEPWGQGGAPSNTIIKDNYFFNNTGSGIRFECGTWHTVFTNFTVYNNKFNNSNGSSSMVNINFSQCTSGSIYFNTTKTSATNIIGGSNIGGNAYFNNAGTDTSTTCLDENLDDICDVYKTLYATTSSYDYLPLFNGTYHPLWSNNMTNTTAAGASTLYSLMWNSTDKVNSNNSAYYFCYFNGDPAVETNGSGDIEAGDQGYIAPLEQSYNWTSEDKEAGTQAFTATATYAQTGQKLPTTNAQDTSGANNWTTPANLYLDDASRTTAISIVSKKHYWGGFAMGIPAAYTNITMNSIDVVTQGSCNVSSTTVTHTVAISNNSGATRCPTTASVSYTTTTDTNKTTTTGLWGCTWTVAQANGIWIWFNATTIPASRQIRVDAAWVNISYYVNEKEANRTWVAYTTVNGNQYDNIDKVKATLTVTVYDPGGSNSTGWNDLRPDMEVGFWNGTNFINNTFCRLNTTMGETRNTTAYNCTVSTTDSTVRAGWGTLANRKVQIRGVYFDSYSTYLDAISVTGVYAGIDGRNNSGVEKNQTAVTYSNVIAGALYTTLTNVTVVVNVSKYNNTGSVARGNNATNLWLSLYNGATYQDFGPFNVAGTGNVTMSTQDPTILADWTYAPDRDMKVQAIYMDAYDGGNVDAINWTDVWVYITSTESDMTNDPAVMFTDAMCPTPKSICYANVTKTASSTVGATVQWGFTANNTLGQSNSTACSTPFTYLTTSPGGPDINLSFGPPSTTGVRIGQCGPQIQNDSAVPENQTATYGIDYVCNNGTATGTIQIKLSGATNPGWPNVWASNTSISTYLINLTTTYQTIYTDLTANSCSYIWLRANCTNASIGMGVYEDYRII
jgi:hypothetical protein